MNNNHLANTALCVDVLDYSDFVQLWVHEARRVFMDRLSTDDDQYACRYTLFYYVLTGNRTWLEALISDSVRKHLGQRAVAEITKDAVSFHLDFASLIGQPSVCCLS